MQAEKKPREGASELQDGIQVLTNGRFSSELAALRDTLLLLGDNAAEIEQRLQASALPAERLELEKFLINLGRLQGGAAGAQEHAEQLARTHQWAGLNIEESLPTGPQTTSALERDPVKIDTGRILIVTKFTKIQYDQHRWKLPNEEDVIRRYTHGAEDVRRIVSSHKRQLKALERLRRRFPDAQLVPSPDLRRHHVRDADLVVSFGGDNHFQFVSHFVRGDTPLLGVNSDPSSSTGALLPFDTTGFLRALKPLSRGDYRFAAWTRLDADLNGRKIGPVTCDLFVGQRNRDLMSRHTLEIDSQSWEQKSSGMLIATGAGSSGWYGNAVRALYPEGRSFPRSASYARFLLTEVDVGVAADSAERVLVLPPKTEGVLARGGELIIQSLNRKGGMVSCDSLKRHNFERGRVLKVSLAEAPLWIVHPEK